MPSHKSAAKRVRQNEKRRARNRHYKSIVKHNVQKVRVALNNEDFEAAAAALPEALSSLARAASKNVIPQKRASRSISRLTLAVNKGRAEG